MGVVQRISSSLSKKMALVVIYLFLVPASANVVYNRTHQNLTEMPDIPINTTHLFLGHNRISEANPAVLSGRPIINIYLYSNQFTAFPDLEIIGTTLRAINLMHNNISTIPTELIDGLPHLASLNLRANQIATFPNLAAVGSTLFVLELSGNQISVISPEDLASLDVIRYLNMRSNLLSSLPNVSVIADTLLNIRIETYSPSTVSEANILSWTLDMNFQVLQIFEVCCGEFTEFPNFGTSCTNIEVLAFQRNQVTAINETYIKYCKSVENFRMDFNKLQQFPDLRVMGATLETLNLAYNDISDVSDVYLQSLVELQNVRLEDNNLQQFPNFSASQKLRSLNLARNSITVVDGAILSKMTSLEYLNLLLNSVHDIADVALPHLEKLVLSFNDFQAFPQMTQLGKNLKSLDLSKNPGIKDISEDDLVGLEVLESLILSGTSLRSVPAIHRLLSLQILTLSTQRRPTPIRFASAYAMASLRNLTEMYLESTELELLPYPCASGGLTLHLKHNERLLLCDTRLAWLKDESISVHVTDVSCGAQMWSNLSYTDLGLLGSNNVEPGTTASEFFLGIFVTLLKSRVNAMSTFLCF